MTIMTDQEKKYTPTVEDLSAYVNSLKMYLDDGYIKDENVLNTVKNFPHPLKVKNGLSNEECKLLFESVRWAWKEITKKDLLELSTFKSAPETLMGNYWMVSGGMLFHGVNHYTMIKQNLSLFSSILNIDPFVMHEKLSGPPTEVIKLIIDNGGARAYISPDKKAYFQMNDKEYGLWGKKKVKHLDFKEKIVKLIDPNIKYDGWKSGFIIVL